MSRPSLPDIFFDVVLCCVVLCCVALSFVVLRFFVFFQFILFFSLFWFPSLAGCGVWPRLRHSSKAKIPGALAHIYLGLNFRKARHKIRNNIGTVVVRSVRGGGGWFVKIDGKISVTIFSEKDIGNLHFASGERWGWY